MGYFLDAAPFAEIFVLPISNIESTISCVKVLVTPQDLVFYYGLSFSSWMIIFLYLALHILFGNILLPILVPIPVLSTPCLVGHGSPEPYVGWKSLINARLAS